MSHSIKVSFENIDRYYEIGANINYYRRLMGLTQAQLSEKAGISRAHLSAIEAPNIVRPFSIELLFRIADALDVHPAKLLESRIDRCSLHSHDK